MNKGGLNMAFIDNVPTIGEILMNEFMVPINISPVALAKSLGVPQNSISSIINGKCGVSVDIDLRLCKYFGLTDGYFIGMQFDFERIETRQKIREELNNIVPLTMKIA
jgi:addiction module HigA family antidote